MPEGFLHPFSLAIASEARQSQPHADRKDCFVIPLLAMTITIFIASSLAMLVNTSRMYYDPL